MLFLSADDFFQKAKAFSRMEREEEINCARLMENGDLTARERLIQSYMPVVAAAVRKVSPAHQSLSLVVLCLEVLERTVDSFDFFQNSETFTHCLSNRLKQTVTRYIAQNVSYGDKL